MDMTLHGNIAEIVHTQTQLSGYDSHEDLVFDTLNTLVNQKIKEGIEVELQYGAA